MRGGLLSGAENSVHPNGQPLLELTHAMLVK